jgi:hypothetical protein
MKEYFSGVVFLWIICFGGLGVCMLASGTPDRGFAPHQSNRIFLVGKIHSMPSFGGKVK